MQDRHRRRPWARWAAVLVALATVAVVAPAGVADAQTTDPRAGGEFFPVTPTRIYDTRGGVPGARVGAISTVETPSLVVTGAAGIPTDDSALAVAVNVTIDAPEFDGYLTLFPTGSGVPTASNVNFAPGQTVANLAVVGVGNGNQVSIQLGPPGRPGTAHVILDVVGWYARQAYTGGRGGRLVPVAPARIMDSRTGFPVAGPFGSYASYDLQVRGARADDGSVPVPDDPNVTAVVLNLTGTRPTNPTYVRTEPAGEPPAPGALRPSSLNLSAGQTRPNLVMVKLGPTGGVNLFNLTGDVELIADVVGYFVKREDASQAGRVVPLSSPFRAIETRGGVYAGDGVKLGPGQEDTWDFAPFVASLNAGNVGGVIMNVTATELTLNTPRPDSWMAVYPDDAPAVPNASNLNYFPDENVPNLTVAKFSGDKRLGIYNDNGSVHYLADVGAVILAD